MGQASFLSPPVLEQFLLQALHTKAVVSLRLQSLHSRILGDLRLHAFKAGSALELSGLHPRDTVPTEGTPVTLTVLLGEEVLTLESALLLPTQNPAAGLLLRLAWPVEGARLHSRRDLRVAAPDQAPLKAQVELQGRTLDALLVNLTETGVGLAFQEALMVDLHADVRIDAALPNGAHLRCPGEVRHLTYLEGQDYPTRLGIVLHPRPDTDLEPIRRFIQARRTDRSHTSR
jgi:hypothetical protein